MEFHLNIVSVAFHTILLKYSFRSLAIYPANFIPTPTRGLLSFFYNLTNVQRFWNLAPQKLHISRQPATTSFYTPVAKLFTRRLLSREIARAETTIVRDNRYDRICQTCCKSLKKRKKRNSCPITYIIIVLALRFVDIFILNCRSNVARKVKVVTIYFTS